MWAVVFLALVAVCAAQVPTPCTVPKQWESRRIRYDRKKSYFDFAKFSYDALDKRTRTIEEVRTGSEREFYDTLRLHNIQTEYKLNLRTKKCNVTQLTRPFFEYMIPPNAHFDFEAEVGPVQIPNEHITIQEWDGKFGDNTTFYMTVTYPDCFPVALDFFNSGEDFGERYFDMTAGIPDPDVFIPPSECVSP